MRSRSTAPRARKRHTGTLLGIVVATVLGSLFFGAFAVITVGGLRAAEGMERVAYFADWNTANRGYLIKDVHDSGAAARLTRLFWAFGDISADGMCHIPENADQPWNIYQRRYAAEESVDGQADTYRQPLAGSLNQLGELKERHPHLRTAISLGGWNWSRYFSTAAATPESREAFAESCIDLWIEGDLPVLDGEPQGGEGVAAGLFDGIDLDWEWPGGNGHEHNVTRPDDKRNFTLLVRELRRQLDAYAEKNDRELSLTVSLPHDEETMRAGVEPEVFELVDFATVQGYGFTGTWSDTTGHHSQLYAPEGAPSDASVHAAVQRYLDHGLPADKLVVGFPGFGRGWRGVDPDGFGRFAPAEGVADGGYGEGTEAFSELAKGEGRRFFDPINGAFWRYDGEEWWSYDSPEVVRLKGDYVCEHGLGGLMLWNLDMDPDARLVRAMDESLGPTPGDDGRSVRLPGIAGRATG